MSQRRVCDFYNRPQGCRKRSNCGFLHEPRDTFGPPSAFTPRASHNPRPDNIPDGVCRYHWSSGTCKYANCWFKHIRPNESPSASPTVADSWRSRSSTTLTAAGLSGGRSLLRPDEAKRQLSTIFLKPGYRFGLPSTVNRFVMILVSSSVANGWVFYIHTYYDHF